MILSLAEISAAEFAARMALRKDAGDWLVLLAPQRSAVASAADELYAELSTADPCPVARLSGPADGAEILRQVQAHLSELLILSDVEDLSEADWAHIDLRRSELARSLCLALVCTRPTLERMLRAAPNLSSWLSGPIWHWRPDEMSADQTHLRLKALREATGRTDEEILQLAQQGRLPRDPEYAEWLVLLGRGDLL